MALSCEQRRPGQDLIQNGLATFFEAERRYCRIAREAAEYDTAMTACRLRQAVVYFGLCVAGVLIALLVSAFVISILRNPLSAAGVSFVVVVTLTALMRAVSHVTGRSVR